MHYGLFPLPEGIYINMIKTPTSLKLLNRSQIIPTVLMAALFSLSTKTAEVLSGSGPIKIN